MARKKPKKLDLLPIGIVSGADDFEEFYPNEMMRLGTLSAYWSLVEDSLCGVLTALLACAPKAEAAFYSTVNHKARRDMVLAVSRNTDLTDRARDCLQYALDVTSDAAGLRNNLLHGLFKMEPHSGELLSVRHRPVAKRPIVLKKGIMNDINSTIEKCELAVDLLRSAAMIIKWPNWPEDFERAMKGGVAKKQKSSP
jgi:hypothetical protein